MIIYHIIDDNINVIFFKLLSLIKNEGIDHYNKTKNSKTKEIEDVFIELINPQFPNCVITSELRDISFKYMYGELWWFFKGNYDVNGINKFSKFWDNIQMNGLVNSNYGHIAVKDKIEQYGNKSQFTWCIRELKAEPESRRAIINYNQPKHKYKENKDFPCALTQQFRIINNELISKICMRANDLIYGFTYNIIWFSRILDILYWYLSSIYKDLKLGKIIYYTSSMRLYEKHYNFLDKLEDPNISKV